MKRVLFVCTGNICRSPTAEGVTRQLLEQHGLGHLIEVDSAGTHGYHAGEAPDPRARKAAAKRGYDLSALRARKLEPDDYRRFDLLLAMDADHMRIMQRACPEVYRPRLQMFLSFAPELELEDVPDPYYGGEAGFEAVLDYCEAGAKGLIRTLSAS